MNIIGLEVSTTAAKCILYSVEEGVIDAFSVKYGSGGAGASTIAPERVLIAAKQAVKKVMQNAKGGVSAIGLVGAWHSLLLLDENRSPTGPIYTWEDVSAGSTVHGVTQKRQFTLDVYYRTGCMVHAMYPVWKYYHLRKTKPAMIKDAKYISSQVEYLFEHLTGEQAVSKCIASGSGFFNIHNLDWDHDLLDFVHLEPESFSPLHDGPYVGGLRASVAKELGLAPNIPVTLGFADGAMNQMAVAGESKGVMSFSVGTSAAIRMISDEPVIPAVPSTWCYYLFAGKRLVGAATQGACNCLDWFLASLPEGVANYASLEKAAAKTKLAEAPYFLPFIFGERCPGWQDQRLGEFADIRSTHSIGDFYYAIMEGVLFNLYHCYELLTKVTEKPDQIFVSGGITNSPLWLQMAADIFNQVLRTTGTKDDSTVGGALMALRALGKQGTESFRPKIAEIKDPHSKNSETYRQRFQRYLELYGRTVPQ